MTKTCFEFGILVIVICLIFVIWNLEFLFLPYCIAPAFSCLLPPVPCQLPTAACPLYSFFFLDFLDSDLGKVYKKACLARIFHELLSRDREDGRATWQQSRGTAGLVPRRT